MAKKTVETEDSAGNAKPVEIHGKRVGEQEQGVRIVGARPTGKPVNILDKRGGNQ